MRPLTPACLRVRSKDCAGLPSDSGRAGIWVTETTLSRVFERYVRGGADLLDRCCTQPRPRRFSSTCTPVEEQRRTGRSQAARLNILSTCPAVRPRMPTLRPCSRPRPHVGPDSAAAAAAAACWRWAAPLTLPALRRRHEIVSTISDLSVIISDSTPALFRRGPPAPPGGSISETLARAGEAISEARGHADLEGVKLYIDFVGRQVTSGLASAREMRAALDVIARALEENCWLDEGDRAVLLGDLCSQIIYGMRAPAARKNLGHLELSDWCALFDVVCRLDIDGLPLLASAMSCMLGEQSAPTVEAHIRALLAVMAGGAEGHEDSAAALLVNAAQDFSASVMVSGADPGTQGPKSSSSSSSIITRTQLCAAWVAITTCTPFIGVVELFGALGDVCPDIGRLDDELVCRLLMARWASQESHLDMSPCRDMFDQLRGAHANQHTPALLMLAICRLPDPAAHVLRCRELWLAMNSLGRGEHVVAAFSELAPRHHGMLETYHLRLAAMTAHDHRFAIRLHSLMCEHAATLPDRGMEWGWEGWAGYAESMCADEGLDPMKIWRLLGVLDRTSDHRLSTAEHKDGMVRGRAGVPSRQQAAMVETVLQRLAGETRLDAHKALRVVVRGVEWLLFCKATITEETMEAARRVVGRYIDERGKGLGKSCGWLLRVMRRWQVDRGLTPWRPSQYRGCRLAPLPG